MMTEYVCQQTTSHESYFATFSFMQPPSGLKMPSLTISWQRLESTCLRWCPNISNRSRSVQMLVSHFNVSFGLKMNTDFINMQVAWMCVCAHLCVGDLLQRARGDDPSWWRDPCADLPEGPHQRPVQEHDWPDRCRHPEPTEPLRGSCHTANTRLGTCHEAWMTCWNIVCVVQWNLEVMKWSKNVCVCVFTDCIQPAVAALQLSYPH